jgi:nucleotide-binding universal stress UspA family protein
MLPFNTILFATDFSPASREAFEVATGLARDYKARLIAMHVIPPIRADFAEFSTFPGPDEDRSEALRLLHEIQSPGHSIEHQLLEGDPASVIAETAAATGADIIVMGTHGRTGFRRLMMGSVAEEVLRQAPCPVLTVRGLVKARVEEPEAAPQPAVI